ncbi:hypothetical protein LFM09_03280 [Lentzea alba]|uniref:hypothetical protein n=1 Tax=Lentzea alba TaxID=2714351 RepID=UPI0039BF2E0F
MREGLTLLWAILVVLASAAGAWIATKRLRPWSAATGWVVLVVAAIAFISSFGSKSLWLTLFGEPANGCVATEYHSHTPRTSPTYWWNELDCGSRKITYFPSPAYSAKPVGEQIDLVVDPTGFAGYAEPGTIKPLISSLVGVAALAGAAYVALVLWLPERKPKRRPHRRVDRDFV